MIKNRRNFTNMLKILAITFLLYGLGRLVLQGVILTWVVTKYTDTIEYFMKLSNEYKHFTAGTGVLIPLTLLGILVLILLTWQLAFKVTTILEVYFPATNRVNKPFTWGPVVIQLWRVGSIIAGASMAFVVKDDLGWFVGNLSHNIVWAELTFYIMIMVVIMPVLRALFFNQAWQKRGVMLEFVRPPWDEYLEIALAVGFGLVSSPVLALESLIAGLAYRSHQISDAFTSRILYRLGFVVMTIYLQIPTGTFG